MQRKCQRRVGEIVGAGFVDKLKRDTEIGLPFETNGGYDSASLVRGVDEFGHFQLEPTPQGDFDSASIEAYRKALLTPGGIGGADDEIYDSNIDLSHIV